MAVFTRFNQIQVDALLSCYGLGSCRNFTGVVPGSTNTTYQVHTPQGAFALTVFEQQSQQELSFGLELQYFLAQVGFSCPQPLVAKDGALSVPVEGKFAAFSPWLSGESVFAPETYHCEILGCYLAQFHLACLSYKALRPYPFGLSWLRRSLNPDWLAQLDHAEMLRQELSLQNLYRFADLPRGMIHGDVFPDNVLFEQGIPSFLDFAYVGTDVLLLDLAIAANAWCISATGQWLHAHAKALLGAYDRTRQLTPLEKGAWPVMLRLAALRFCVSRLDRARELDLSGVPSPIVGKLPGAGEYLRILQLHQMEEFRCRDDWPT